MKESLSGAGSGLPSAPPSAGLGEPAPPSAGAGVPDLPPPPAEEPLPPLLGCLFAVWGGARGAWSPALLVPAWLAALLAYLIWEVALPAAGPGGSTGGVLLWLGAAATAALIWSASALVLVLAAWEFGRGERLGWAEGLRVLAGRRRSVLWAPLFVPGGAALLLLLSVAGAALLSAVPLLGRWLWGAWLVVAGIPLSLLAAGLLLLGLPALPLTLSSACLELPFPFDAASRSMSYVRARPGRYLALLLAGLGGAAAGTAVFLTLVLLVIGGLCLASRPGALLPGGAGLAGLTGAWESAVGQAWLLWPFGGAPEGGAAAGTAPGVAAWLAVLSGRALTGYAGAALVSAVARTYLVLRWGVDGESPAALLRPGEEFHWSE